MIRYIAAAMALKLLPASPATRRLYRLLGSALLWRRRVKRWLPAFYVDRARSVLEAVRKHEAVRPGDRVLELGTGWAHWESTVLRLFYDVDVTLFDVRDGRWLWLFKRYFGEFAEVIDEEIDATPRQLEHARRLLRAILSVDSFDDLYGLLGFEYAVEPSGTLCRFQDASFDAVCSFAVLEHVKEESLATYVRDMHRLLRPGGYSIHQIDLRDHLHYCDPGVSPKNYLRYSDRVWERYFESEFHYVNRIQRAEWLALFRAAGLELVEEQSLSRKLGVEVDGKYGHLDRQDLECVSLKMIHRKPA